MFKYLAELRLSTTASGISTDFSVNKHLCPFFPHQCPREAGESALRQVAEDVLDPTSL